MNINKFTTIGIVLAVITIAAAGCNKKAEDESIGDKTGAALDSAVESTSDAAQVTGETIKDVTGKVVEKTGEVLEKTGAVVEKSGDDLQK